MTSLRSIYLSTLVAAAILAGCTGAEDSIFCPNTGIVCPQGTVCAAAEATCLTSSCGNLISDPGEECDDGNTQNGDGCSSVCKKEICGNGITDGNAGEECDDGNAVGGDGCSKFCKKEFCGNGVTDDGEACDDGNAVNGDGCTGVVITISDGMGGEKDSPEPCMSTETCGNNIVDFQVGEVCDDGNTAGGDSCSPDCRSGLGCGNGIVDPGEECDDGNKVDTDRCRNSCKFAVCGDGVRDTTREQCDGGDPLATTPAARETADCNIDCTNAICGDAKINLHTVPPEQCDQGFGQNGPNKNCLVDCKLNVCGDGKQDLEPPGVEGCDDGNMINTDACSNACVSATCGNATVDNGEPCDDGNHDDTDSCIECKLAFCGDGKLRAGVEQCDDGNTVNGDHCDSNCRIEGCGNGVIDSGEECDDGNMLSNDNCLFPSCALAKCGDGEVRVGVEQCEPPNTATCSPTCQSRGCGNGVIDPGEQCDDGCGSDHVCTPGVGTGKDDGDGCSYQCKFENCGDGIVNNGEQCDGGSGAGPVETATCNIDCTTAMCGDGKVNSHRLSPGGAGNPPAGQPFPEQCDDAANNSEHKDCRANCLLNVCGDGALNDMGSPAKKELCDDGNTIPNDACSNSCTLASCGNGIKQPGEECDDGNMVDTDACTNTCKNAVCGDGIVGPGEQCDGTNGCTKPSVMVPGCRTASCGDGILETTNDVIGAYTTESCDDHNTTSGDGCSSSCVREFCGDGIKQAGIGEVCDWNDPATPNCNFDCLAAGVCGDGKKSKLEECDDAGTVSGDGCSSTCKLEDCGNGVTDNAAGEQCDAGPSGSPTCGAPGTPSACRTISCGNNIVDGADECEPKNTATCDSNCKRIKFCGDGVKEGSEGCDQPGGNSNTSECLTNCTVATCGDGFVETTGTAPHEQCDDGSRNGMETCPYATSCMVCDTNCALVAGTFASCGDHVVQTANNEACDPAGPLPLAPTTTTTGCDTHCQIIPVVGTCGNGTIDMGEVCDLGPGNNDNNHCIGSGGGMPAYNSPCAVCNSSCTAVSIAGGFCGDGTKNGTEQCDGMSGTTCPGGTTGTATCSGCTLNTSACVPTCTTDGMCTTAQYCDTGGTNVCKPDQINGGACSRDAQCDATMSYCTGTVCAAKGAVGDACSAANQCLSGNCDTVTTMKCVP